MRPARAIAALLFVALSVAPAPRADALVEHAIKADDREALRSADLYIKNGRRGTANVVLDGVAAGTQAHVRLGRHAFHFGINLPGTFNRFLIDNAPPTSDAWRFQRFVLDHFNTVVPSNGGKWIYNEGAREFVTMEYIDLMLRWAARHHMFARMHTMLWDTEQQPVWVDELLTAAAAGNAAAKEDLRRAIDRRIDYYVRDRACAYQELDVINESVHHPRFIDVFGAAGIADIFRRAARAGCADPPLRLFLNEYDLLQFSRDPRKGPGAPTDRLGNWYLQQITSLLEAGAPVTGVGVQYYADASKWSAEPHSAARIRDVLTNLGTTNLPVELTEFGIRKPGTPDDWARVLEETMRMVFGTEGTTGFVMFGFWAGAIWDTAPNAVLVDKDWNLTEAGKRYEKLMAEWSTDLTMPVAAGGAINFAGFYGDYTVEVPGKTFAFELVRNKRQYQLR